MYCLLRSQFLQAKRACVPCNARGLLSARLPSSAPCLQQIVSASAHLQKSAELWMVSYVLTKLTTTALPLLCPWSPSLRPCCKVQCFVLKPLQVGDGGMLGQALEHCMYTGGALGRVGLDFRPALPPLFESRILSLFTKVGCCSRCVAIYPKGSATAPCRLGFRMCSNSNTSNFHKFAAQAGSTGQCSPLAISVFFFIPAGMFDLSLCSGAFRHCSDWKLSWRETA